MKCEMYRAILTAQTQPNAGKERTMLHSANNNNHSKNAAKETQKFLEAKKYDILQWPSESPDLNPIEQLLSHLRQN